MSELVYPQESYDIIGACFEVYNEMGCGFLEAVYQECLELEFAERGIPFRPREKLVLRYKGMPLKRIYRPDFVCFEKIIIEIKALKAVSAEHRSQANYLKGTGYKLGLLVNFGQHPKLQYERIVR
jgi:GxxExxY protein